jgi:hypothetical protein
MGKKKNTQSHYEEHYFYLTVSKQEENEINCSVIDG